MSCLCNQPFADSSTESLDINFNGDLFSQFDDAVAEVFTHLTTFVLKNAQPCPILMKKSSGHYNVSLSSSVSLEFHLKCVFVRTDPVSYALHSSDVDISQVAFTGETRLIKEISEE